MQSDFLLTKIDKAAVVEFQMNALMDAMILEPLGEKLYKLVEEQDLRIIVLDFARVEYISSQMIGIVMGLHKKLNALPHSKLILCSINSKLMELLKITRLDRVLTVKKSQKEAINSITL
jgi:anti-sigma B factor antagonist